MIICICGGGNLGHVVAGFVAAQGKHDVRILTQRPERWSEDLVIEAPNQTTYSGHLSGIFSDAKQAVSDAEIILLCLPGFAIRNTLLQIKDFLRPDAAVGTVVSSTGFFFQAIELLSKEQTLFGFQRVPFISRVIEYGHRASLLGFKDSLNLAIEHTDNPGQLRDVLADMLQTPIQLLANHYEASLSNSNPLLHPSRLYSLWKDWEEGTVYSRIPLFYEEWTDEAAQLYIDMDKELQTLLEFLPVRKGSISTVLDYYESTDATSLANKLRSITAFKGIKSPMREVEGGYVPDFKSRYFTEDFPYGLAVVHKLAQEKNINTPTMEKVLNWGMKMLRHTFALAALLSVMFMPTSCSTDDSIIEDSPAENTSTSENDPITVSEYFNGKLLAICHRGLSGYPENTFVAVDAAATDGFKAIECDICMTKDSVFVLHHDPTIDRCSNGTGRINDMTYKELLAYDYGSWKDAKFKGEQIVRLDDLLDYFKVHGLIIELDLADETRFKRQWLPYLYTLVKNKGMIGQTMFTATKDEFSDFLSVKREIIISVSGVYRMSQARDALTLKDKVSLCNFSVPYQYLTTELSDYAHSNGAKIKTWTITNQSDLKKVLDLGADYVITELSYSDVKSYASNL